MLNLILLNGIKLNEDYLNIKNENEDFKIS